MENPQDASFYQPVSHSGSLELENSTNILKTGDNNYQTLCTTHTTEPHVYQDISQGELVPVQVIYEIYLSAFCLYLTT